MSAPGDETAEPEDTLDIRAADLIDVLAKRNPGASSAQVAFAARVMKLIGTAIRPTHATSLAALREMEASLAPADDEADERVPGAGSQPRRHILQPRRPIEIGKGTGLGPMISLTEGRRRLAAYVSPLTMEEWAGPLAGATELNKRLGIARSTLQDWRRDGSVIGLLKSRRKHVFPLAQFVDGRPVPGLAELAAIIGNPRTVWLWLVEPDRNGDSYLNDLKCGRIEDVLEAAREDFA